MAKILITGTSKGIGYNAALYLAKAGHEVIATMRNPGGSDLEKVATEGKLPIQVLPMDVDEEASIDSVFADHADSIDVLINNAGIFSINAVEDESMEKVRHVMETNYFGAVACIQRVLPGMRKRGSGCIINLSSIAGRVAFFSGGAYSASKFALEALSESLAQEVSSLGIRVALVEPGIIDTAMATTNLPQYKDDSIYPQGRRMHAIFNNPDKPEASPNLVSELIQYIIESGDSRLRYPVGPDALPFIGWRASVSDEHWVELNSTKEDAVYYEHVFRETGIDLRSK